jgi:hypothetical protein
MRYQVLATFVALGLDGLLSAQPPGRADEIPPKVQAFIELAKPTEGDSTLRKLQKERHNAAVRMLQERIEEYQKEIRDITYVFEAAKLVAEAKLALAETQAERVAVLEQTLEVARLIESRLKERLERGLGSRADFELATYSRLSVEIRLLEEKKKGP